MGKSVDLPTIARKLERNLEGYIAFVMTVVYTVLIVWNVLARNLIGSEYQIPDSLTITLGLVAWVAWLSASWGIRRQSHLRFLLFRDRASDRMQYLLFVLEWALWLLISGIILWVSLPLLEQRMGAGATTPELRIPTWIFFLSIPVGFSLMLLRTLQQSYDVTKRYRNGESIGPDSNITD